MSFFDQLRLGPDGKLALDTTYLHRGDWLKVKNRDVRDATGRYFAQDNPDKGPNESRRIVLKHDVADPGSSKTAPRLVEVHVRTTSENYITTCYVHDSHGHVTTDRNCCCDLHGYVTIAIHTLLPEACHKGNFRCAEDESSPLMEMI